MALFMALAGCTESIEDEIKEIVEIPRCDDSTAMNYDENATNSDACLTELALEQAMIVDFAFASRCSKEGEIFHFRRHIPSRRAEERENAESRELRSKV